MNAPSASRTRPSMRTCLPGTSGAATMCWPSLRRPRRCRRTPSGRTVRRRRRCTRGAGQQRRELHPIVGGDRRPERLVGAVLAPRLGQRFQFDVGGIASLLTEVRLNRPQLLGVERQRRGRRRALRGRPRRGRRWRSPRRPPLRCRSDRVEDRRCPSCQCSMIGLATRRAMTLSATAGSVPATNSTRRPDELATSGTPSTSAAACKVLAGTSVTPGWRVISNAGPPCVGVSQLPDWSSGSTRKEASRVR